MPENVRFYILPSYEGRPRWYISFFHPRFLYTPLLWGGGDALSLYQPANRCFYTLPSYEGGGETFRLLCGATRNCFYTLPSYEGETFQISHLIICWDFYTLPHMKWGGVHYIYLPSSLYFYTFLSYEGRYVPNMYLKMSAWQLESFYTLPSYKGRHDLGMKTEC